MSAGGFCGGVGWLGLFVCVLVPLGSLLGFFDGVGVDGLWTVHDGCSPWLFARTGFPCLWSAVVLVAAFTGLGLPVVGSVAVLSAMLVLATLCSWGSLKLISSVFILGMAVSCYCFFLFYWFWLDVSVFCRGLEIFWVLRRLLAMELLGAAGAGLT